MRTLLALSLLAMLGCDAKPVSTTSTNNQEIKVDMLFTHQGITVFRFNDGGHNVYFTKQGDIHSVYSESCGKNCIKEVRIMTFNGVEK